MQLKITQILMMLAIASFVSSISQLNIMGKNIEKKIKKPSIVYISGALMSTVSGLLLSLTFMLFTKNIIIWIIVDICGAIVGENVYKLAFKLVLVSLNLFKNADFGKMIDDLDNNKDAESNTTRGDEDKDST